MIPASAVPAAGVEAPRVLHVGDDPLADVDGARTRIYPTDYALRGVFVPAGRHTLTFSYVPAGLRLGAAIAGLALLVLIVLSIPPVGRRVIGPAR